MNDTVILIEELKLNWKALFLEIQKSKRFKFDLFSETFSHTYELLSKHLTESSLDKSYIELIADAYLFANIKDDSLGSKALAAFILTERMLNSCAFNASDSVIETAPVYIFEARKDVILNFTNVNESVNKLEKIFEKTYWETLNS